MRLRQLSRKLEVKTDKILEFLAKTGHPMENAANGKLTEEQVLLLMEEFPSPLKEFEEEVIIEEVVAPTQEINVDVQEEVIEEAPAELEEIIELEVPMAPPADSTSQISKEVEVSVKEAPEAPAHSIRLFKALEELKNDPNIELIKAPEIKLEGLKVLGKIVLPEPKEKPEKEIEEIKQEEAPRRKIRPAQKNGKPVNGHDENPIERERLRQEKIAARRKRDAEQKLKDKKTKNYRQQVKTKPVPQKPKKKKKSIESPIEAPIEAPIERSAVPILGQNTIKAEAPQPTQNKLTKFWRWLNGKYDKF